MLWSVSRMGNETKRSLPDSRRHPGFLRMLALQVSSLVLLLLSAIFNVISLATDSWITTPGVRFGIWRLCDLNACGNLRNDADIDATRAFSIISFLLLLVAFFVQIYEIWSETVKKVTGFLSFCAGVCALIGMSVFVGSFRSAGFTTYSWSFALGWVSTGLSLVAGAVAFVTFKNNPQ
ncbi:epithelial membrane protein 1-like [Ambystoma mexicanum]|uniref:epithelial membrane protein 1-like n=1 Tax=Ambystoma mexicanum TaxID=8296 RepID=UPI0037E7BC0C